MITRDHFSSEFDATIVERPGGSPDHAFAAPGAAARAVEIVVTPWSGPAWTATFAAPDQGFRALTALLGTPSATGLCVVERGTAFVGEVLDPAVFGVVETQGPVVDAKELPADGLLLLLTPWSITAVDQLGRRWTSGRIAIDGLRIDEASDGWLRGVADPDDDEPRDFAVILATGEVVGGAGIA